jgi:hypothetical protein
MPALQLANLLVKSYPKLPQRGNMCSMKIEKHYQSPEWAPCCLISDKH